MPEKGEILLFGMMMMMMMMTTMMLLISKWIVRHFGRQYVKILILFLFLYWTTTRSRRYASSSERERFLEPTWLRVHQFKALKNPEITRRIPYLFRRLSAETLDDKDKNTYLHHVIIFVHACPHYSSHTKVVPKWTTFIQLLLKSYIFIHVQSTHQITLWL